MQVMIKFLNSTKKKTLKEQIIDLELNKFSSLEDFSKKVLFILKNKYKINNIVFIDGGNTFKGCEYKYYLRFKTTLKEIKSINFDDLENIINEKKVNEIKLIRVKNLMNKIFDKAVNYEINMDLWEYQKKRLNKIFALIVNN
ncbi:hypothetical protein [Arcobacter ellisii]|jgi:hypothetical protein|uniref:Uncharacterized protein n=1 Tax=Arcobacter ellisii TaxID=913109 RepID=A0A347U8D1_9BACT|nr:hypothetical protein [Arcobacter ellisii]AXX95109.1 hypothetical protein AELL_1447 [Arcobacter ellisii]RXI28999.1 hypothetical protein CP962_12320 [Arcobacter ellisii]